MMVVGYVFEVLVLVVIVRHSRHFINACCIQRIEFKGLNSGCYLSASRWCPQLHLVFLCPRGCWDNQFDNFEKAWERKVASEFELLLLVLECLLRDPGALRFGKS